VVLDASEYFPALEKADVVNDKKRRYCGGNHAQHEESRQVRCPVAEVETEAHRKHDADNQVEHHQTDHAVYYHRCHRFGFLVMGFLGCIVGARQVAAGRAEHERVEELTDKRYAINARPGHFEALGVENDFPAFRP